MHFEADQNVPGTGGHVTLWAGDTQIGEGELPHTISLIFTTYAGMDIGRDNGGVVDLDYEARAPYAFTGTVRNVVFDLKPAAIEDEEGLHRHRRTGRTGTRGRRLREGRSNGGGSAPSRLVRPCVRISVALP